MIKRLISDYSRRLGAAAVSSDVHADIIRLAEIEAVIWDRRAALLRHETVDLAAVVRLENVAARLRRALGLDVRKPEPESDEQLTVAIYAARCAGQKAVGS